MLEFILPYLFGVALGASFGGGTSVVAPQTAPEVMPAAPEAIPDKTAPALAETAPLAERQPEPQVPSGRFTTAVEIRPILTATKASWIAIRDYDGQDLVYFTQLLSWRCGLWEIRYGLNGAPPTQSLPLEPCHDETASPNALVGDMSEFPIFLSAEAGSVQSVEVEIIYDDGTSDAAVFARQMVLMP